MSVTPINIQSELPLDHYLFIDDGKSSMASTWEVGTIFEIQLTYYKVVFAYTGEGLRRNRTLFIAEKLKED